MSSSKDIILNDSNMLNEIFKYLDLCYLRKTYKVSDKWKEVSFIVSKERMKSKMESTEQKIWHILLLKSYSLFTELENSDDSVFRYSFCDIAITHRCSFDLINAICMRGLKTLGSKVILGRFITLLNASIYSKKPSLEYSKFALIRLFKLYETHDDPNKYYGLICRKIEQFNGSRQIDRTMYETIIEYAWSCRVGQIHLN